MLKNETLKTLIAAEAVLRKMALTVQQSDTNMNNCQYHAGLVRGLLFAAKELTDRRLNSRVSGFSEKDRLLLEPKPGYGPWRPVNYVGFFMSPMPDWRDELDYVLHEGRVDPVSQDSMAELCLLEDEKIKIKKVRFGDIAPTPCGTGMYRVKE